MTARKPGRPVVEIVPPAVPAPIDVAPTPVEKEASVESVPVASDIAEWTAELLDPDAWGEILARYGQTMRLAVGLTNIHGNLIGPCHNPQPVWSLAREGNTPLVPVDSNPGCPFCLTPPSPCSAVRDALAANETVFATDQAGLVHAAIPLTLGPHRLGTLIAGQALGQYPQPLALQRLAKNFGISPTDVWNAAVHQVPVSQATLRVYAELLESLGNAFLRRRYAAILDRQLHETNQRFRLMLEGSKNYALFTVDRTGRVNSWNSGAERLFGYAESEIRGKDYSLFFTPQDLQSGKSRRELREVEQHGWVEDEGWQVRKNGTRFLAETVSARLGAGDACEYGMLLHDVTEERKSAESVLQAQKLESIGVLAGGIAHDFNNLLTSILGNVSLAIAQLPADDPSRPLLDIAEKSSLKAAALISQLLAYAGKGEFIVTQFDLSGLISEILPLIETSIPKTVQLDLNLPLDLPWIDADASEIQQIVMNVVINGAEAFGDTPGVMQVSTGVARMNQGEETEPDGVYLEVKDSGCGMDEETQQKMFDPFFTTKFTGRGLGLAAVSGIVRKLNGRLEVESVPGNGSTFRIVFPAVPAPLAETKVETKARVQSEQRGEGTILVVDDEAMVRQLARAVLERFGYTVLTAENGRDAVATFQRNADTITAVLLDLTMPVMGGGEAFHLMTEIRPEIPIIISSGYGEGEIRQQFTSALAGVIKKPYTVSELREKIAAVLTLRKTSGAGGGS
jgi:PAS domain S-box-containing protein